MALNTNQRQKECFREKACIFESSKSESLNHAYLNQTKV